MRIALVHDYISEFGGAERVLKALTEIYPLAPIYTAFTIKNSTAFNEFKGSKIIESKYAKFLKRGKLYSPLRFLAPKIWQSFDFSKYDVIIASSSWYITKGFKVASSIQSRQNRGSLRFYREFSTKSESAKPGHPASRISNRNAKGINISPVSKKPLIICYCHTPPRYLYGYKTSIEWQRYWPIKLYGTIINKKLRQFDYTSAQQIDWFIANSNNTKKRIKKFYRRSSFVIYPPVKIKQIKKFTKDAKLKDYYLMVSRVVGAKGIGLAMEAINKLGLKLKIVGEPGGLKWIDAELKKLKSSNIEFLGRVTDQELWKLYGECKAFLALAEDEDFGITVVEAMAAGRPVIAYKGGGYLETIIDKKTGIFFDEYSVKGLIKEIKKLNNLDIKSDDCRKQAERFSEYRFKKEIKDFIQKKYNLVK